MCRYLIEYEGSVFEFREVIAAHQGGACGSECDLQGKGCENVNKVGAETIHICTCLGKMVDKHYAWKVL